MTDIKKLIEETMEEMGVSKAEVCRRIGIKPQGWARKMTDPKWSTVEAVCDALDIYSCELFVNTQKETTGFVECPHCHKAIILKAKEQ